MTREVVNVELCHPTHRKEVCVFLWRLRWQFIKFIKSGEEGYENVIDYLQINVYVDSLSTLYLKKY